MEGNIELTDTGAKFTLSPFPTHVPVNFPKRDTTLHKKEKVNGNSFFSMSIPQPVRPIIVRELKKAILKGIGATVQDIAELSDIFEDLSPLKLHLEVHAVTNYDNVTWQKKKGEFHHKPLVERDYPTVSVFDADNFWPYIKCFQDIISKPSNGRYDDPYNKGTKIEVGNMQFLADDSVSRICDTGRVKFFPVKTLEEHKMVFYVELAEDPNQLKLWDDIYGDAKTVIDNILNKKSKRWEKPLKR